MHNPSVTQTATDAQRRHDLDWLRVIAFGLLIFYHVGMFYVTWRWHIKSPHASHLPEGPMALLNPWRLALLFFISGIAIRFAIDNAQRWPFARARLRRLGLPIIAGMLVIVPPQTYLELRYGGYIEPGVWAFYADYLNLDQIYPIITPTWNHLWYVVYVLVYTLLLVPVARPLTAWSEGRGGRAVAWLAGGRYGWRLMLLPALPFVAYRLFLRPEFPTTHALVDDWANHAQCLTIVLFGYVVAKNGAFWHAVARALPAILIVAFAGAAAWMALRGLADAATSPLAQGVRMLYAWVAILALLGLAQRYLNRPGQLLRYLNEAIFPYYILHQTIIVLIGYGLMQLRWPAWAEASTVLAVTIGGCVLLHEFCIRRIGWLRPWFGLKPAAATRIGRGELPGRASAR